MRLEIVLVPLILSTIDILKNNPEGAPISSYQIYSNISSLECPYELYQNLLNIKDSVK